VLGVSFTAVAAAVVTPAPPNQSTAMSVGRWSAPAGCRTMWRFAACCAVALGFGMDEAAASVPAPLIPPQVDVPPVHGAWNQSILVGTHHKTGTVLLAKVFRLAAKAMGVPRSKSNKTSAGAACAELFASGAPGVCIEEHTSDRTLIEWLTPGAPFVHVVRDPLEMCVSAYQYHLLGAEPWLQQPLKDLDGQTLQDYYRRNASRAVGVRFECKRLMNEIIEEALVFNTTRVRGSTLTVFFEEFARSYDDTMRRIFRFLDSGEQVEQLVKLGSQYDLSRHEASDERHVSTADEKPVLRELLFADPLMRDLLTDMRVLLGYSRDGAAPKRESLCSKLRKLCATTNVGFFNWCPHGRLTLGRIPSLPECGEQVKAGAGSADLARGR